MVDHKHYNWSWLKLSSLQLIDFEFTQVCLLCMLYNILRKKINVLLPRGQVTSCWGRRALGLGVAGRGLEGGADLSLREIYTYSVL